MSKAIKFPTNKEVEEILDKWDKDGDSSWDYDSNRADVKRAIQRYKKLISKKNKSCLEKS